MVLLERPLPEPWHTGQGSATYSPRPWQVGHGSETVNPPEVCVMVEPEPSQVGQISGAVPGAAPVPRHAVQGGSEMVCIDTVVPLTAWSNSMLTSPSMSLPRRAVHRRRWP